MTVNGALRPVLAGLLGLGVAACGGAESDARRFETMADRVAGISLSGAAGTEQAAPAPPSAARPKSEAAAARPSPLKVEVMDPHDLWDARDGGLRALADEAAPEMIDAVAPALVEVATRQVTTASEAVARRVLTAADTIHLSPRAKPEAATPAAAKGGETIQLGAFSSDAAARAAWSRLNTGAAAAALDGVSPRYETVEANGRVLTRLKVGPVSSATATEICRAAAIDDPWCRRGT